MYKTRPYMDKRQQIFLLVKMPVTPVILLYNLHNLHLSAWVYPIVILPYNSATTYPPIFQLAASLFVSQIGSISSESLSQCTMMQDI
jgi:hypothetical protein